MTKSTAADCATPKCVAGTIVNTRHSLVAVFAKNTFRVSYIEDFKLNLVCPCSTLTKTQQWVVQKNKMMIVFSLMSSNTCFPTAYTFEV